MAQIKLVEDYQQLRDGLSSLGAFYNKITNYIGGGPKPMPIFDTAKSYFIYSEQKEKNNLRNKINEFRRMTEMSEEQHSHLNHLMSIEATLDDCVRHIEFAEMVARLG